MSLQEVVTRLPSVIASPSHAPESRAGVVDALAARLHWGQQGLRTLEARLEREIAKGPNADPSVIDATTDAMGYAARLTARCREGIGDLSDRWRADNVGPGAGHLLDGSAPFGVGLSLEPATGFADALALTA